MSKFVIVEDYSTEIYETLESAEGVLEKRLREGEEITLYEVTSKHVPSRLVFEKVKL